MDEIRARVIAGISLIVLEVLATSVAIFSGVQDLFVAMIIGVPAVTPALNYRGYTGIDRFHYDRYKSEKSAIRRAIEATVVSVIAGFPAVPVGLAIYHFLPALSRTSRFAVAFVASIVLVFVVGSLVAFKLNEKYLEGVV